jgi:hypothetical protein
MRKYRHKAVAREWFGNGAPTPVSGRLEFVQDEGDMSHSLVDLDGLGGQVSNATKFKKLLLSFTVLAFEHYPKLSFIQCYVVKLRDGMATGFIS